MIHNDVINQLQLLVKTTAPPLLEVAETPADLPHWTAGQKLPAHVLASLPNGRFQVSVGDQVLDMNLPKNTQPGENLMLVYVASQPRLTFVLSRDTPLSPKTNAGAAATLAASNAAAALAAADDAVPLAAAGAGARQPVTLSDTARFIGALMQKVSQQQDDATASSQVKAAAVVTAPPADSRQFALALRGALSQSGLFYESHQAQWVAGERPMAELLREPQGALSLRASPEQLASNASVASQPPVGDAQEAQLMVTLQPDGAHVASGKGMEMVRPETLPLIQQQLQTLDTHQLVWQGQVWPGQQMDWVVEERDAREQGSADEAAENWNTRLRLTMPNLGEVSATLAFGAQGLRINLAAADLATAETLKTAQMRLHHSLEAAGLSLSGLTVEHDGGA
jgi:hypothetical protein